MKERKVNKIVQKNQYDLIKFQNKFLDNANFDLDRFAQAFFLYGINKMDPKTGIAQFSASEFLKITQLSKSYLYRSINSHAIDGMIFQKLVYIDVKRKDKKIISIKWIFVIPSAEYNLIKKQFILKFAPELLDKLVEIKNCFTLIDWRDWRHFKTKYAFSVYLLLKRHFWNKNGKFQITEKNFTIHELKRKLHIYEYNKDKKITNDLYPITFDFLRRVVFPALKEINNMHLLRPHTGFEVINVFKEVKQADGRTKLIVNKYDPIKNPDGVVQPAEFANLTLEKFNEMQTQGRIHPKQNFHRNTVLGIKFKILKDFHNYKKQANKGAIKKETVQIKNLEFLKDRNKKIIINETEKSNPNNIILPTEKQIMTLEKQIKWCVQNKWDIEHPFVQVAYAIIINKYDQAGKYWEKFGFDDLIPLNKKISQAFECKNYKNAASYVIEFIKELSINSYETRKKEDKLWEERQRNKPKPMSFTMQRTNSANLESNLQKTTDVIKPKEEEEEDLENS